MLDLKPCPWCGIIDLLAFAEGEVTSVNCTGCGCLGPWCDANERLGASEAWNLRVGQHQEEAEIRRQGVIKGMKLAQGHGVEELREMGDDRAATRLDLAIDALIEKEEK